jgi:hypothetical protein
MVGWLVACRHLTQITPAFDPCHFCAGIILLSLCINRLIFKQKCTVMKIQVLAEKRIGALQQEFNGMFPFLKLVFFTRPHDAYEGSPAKYIMDEPDRTLGTITKKMREGALYLEAEMPTWQVERLFREEFGLYVQVFRKSGDLWLETSVTDDLTLEQQNAKGKASEKPAETEPIEPPDYREQA